MPRCGMSETAQFYTKALEYYVQKQVLEIRDLAFPLRSFDYFNDLDIADSENERWWSSEIVYMVAANDWLYRNRKQMFSYILHIDRDEVVLPPLQTDTYQELLRHFLSKHHHHRRRRHVDCVTSIMIRSAFFYTQFPAANVDEPTYLPLNRLGYRTPVEEPVRGRGRYAGFAKSFVDTNTCVVNNMWNHKYMRGDETHAYVSAADALVHHFRSSCRMRSSRCASTASGTDANWTIR